MGRNRLRKRKQRDFYRENSRKREERKKEIRREHYLKYGHEMSEKNGEEKKKEKEPNRLFNSESDRLGSPYR